VISTPNRNEHRELFRKDVKPERRLKTEKTEKMEKMEKMENMESPTEDRKRVPRIKEE